MANPKSLYDKVIAVYDLISGKVKSIAQDLADNYYTSEQTDKAIEAVAAYYITRADGTVFPTVAELEAGPWYSDGQPRTPTRNDYAIVTVGSLSSRYIYAGSGWEKQYDIETGDYEALDNKPKINGHELDGDKTGADLGLASLDANGKIPGSELADGAVSSDKIADSAVTADKIGSGAVTADKVADGAITADKIDGSLTADIDGKRDKTDLAVYEQADYWEGISTSGPTVTLTLESSAPNSKTYSNGSEVDCFKMLVTDYRSIGGSFHVYLNQRTVVMGRETWAKVIVTPEESSSEITGVSTTIDYTFRHHAEVPDQDNFLATTKEMNRRLEDKVDKEDGKGLSTNDFTNYDKGMLDGIAAAMPDDASSENKLADKDFVNSSIATNTATFRGTYNIVSDLGLTVADKDDYTVVGEAIAAHIASLKPPIVADNNDYCFVQIPRDDDMSDDDSSESEDIDDYVRIDRYKFVEKADDSSDSSDASESESPSGYWEYEYSINNSSFTAKQWASINSGITSGAVEKLGALPTAEALEKDLADKYEKPSTGIPTDDLANGAVTSDKIESGAVNWDRLAQDVTNAIDGKASKADATLTERGFSAWTFSDGESHTVYEAYDPNYLPNMPWGLYIDTTDLGPGIMWYATKAERDAVTRFTDDRFDPPITATRTALHGYQLGSQSNKPVASETEAEALRQGKQNALSAQQLANIAAVPGKANDVDVVHKTGDETIDGVKTFSDGIASNYDIDNRNGFLTTMGVFLQDFASGFIGGDNSDDHLIHIRTTIDPVLGLPLGDVTIPRASGMVALTSDIDAAISPTSPAFSNAVLSVGLGIDTNTVAVINELVDSAHDLPVSGATSVGALLLALAAAVAALKKNLRYSFHTASQSTPYGYWNITEVPSGVDPSDIEIYWDPDYEDWCILNISTGDTDFIGRHDENDRSPISYNGYVADWVVVQRIYDLADRATNTATIGSSVTSATVTLPAATTGRSRDFYIDLTIEATDAPTLTFIDPATQTTAAIKFGADSLADIAPGDNLVLWTELPNNRWLVSVRHEEAS